MRLARYRASGTQSLALCALLALPTACSNTEQLVSNQPLIHLETSSLDFGTVRVGESVTLNAIVRNDGSGRLELEVDPSSVTEQAFDPSEELSALAPGGLATIEVSFAPSDEREYVSVLTIRSNDRDVEVQLRGTGVLDSLRVEPSTLDFGNVVMGSSGELEVTVTNDGEVDADVELLSWNNADLCSQRSEAEFCLRFLDVAPDADQSFVLGAGQSVRAKAEFRPRIVNVPTNATLRLRACPESRCEKRLEMSGTGVESGLRCQPTSLDFGAVHPGTNATRSVTCENIANEPITLLSWGLGPDSSNAFVAEDSRTVALDAGDSVSIEVLFAPAVLGEMQGILQIDLDTASQDASRLEIQLQGDGGGPNIQVLPPQLNFGRVSTLAPSRRTLVVVNTGSAPLEIAEIQTDLEGTGMFRLLDEAPARVESGDAVALTVEFEPTTEGLIESALRIVSNDSDESTLDVTLRGEGAVLPPCDFVITPEKLDFGAVQRGRALRRSISVHNRGTDLCLLSAVREVGDIAPFTMADPEIRGVEIAPGATALVPVDFEPEGSGHYLAEIELSISNPRNPHPTVELSGVGGDLGLLVSPNELDFGVVAPDCSARARAVGLYNTGASPLTIEAIRFAAPGAPAFGLLGMPTLPHVLATGGSLEFSVDFRADAVSAYAGAVEIEVAEPGGPTTYFVNLTGRGALDPVMADEYTQLGQPKADILFVVDKTGSMREEQDALAQNFQTFIEFAEAQGLDYQLGITTTDTDAADEAGRLSSALPGTAEASAVDAYPANRIITPSTQPNPAAAFASNISFTLEGGGASDESGLRAAEMALSAPVLFGANAGFVRRDAVLAVIFVSDEPDQSSGSVSYFVNFLKSIKGFRNSALFSASAIVALSPPGRCSSPTGTGDAEADGRYQAVAEQTGGVVQSICAADWSRKLEELSLTAFGFKNAFVLRAQPVIPSLQVFVDGVEIPQVGANGTVYWTYDFASNSVIFTPVAVPEAGAQITIEYAGMCG